MEQWRQVPYTHHLAIAGRIASMMQAHIGWRSYSMPFGVRRIRTYHLVERCGKP
jgi:hypothetical protein